MPNLSAKVTVSEKGGRPAELRTAPVMTEIPDPNQTALKRIIELGAGFYIVTVNAERRVERFVKLPPGVGSGELLAALEALAKAAHDEPAAAPDVEEASARRKRK